MECNNPDANTTISTRAATMQEQSRNSTFVSGITPVISYCNHIMYVARANLAGMNKCARGVLLSKRHNPFDSTLITITWVKIIQCVFLTLVVTESQLAA